MTATFDGIIDCLRDGGYHTFRELQGATGFTQQKLERILHFMREFGFIYLRTPYFLSSHITRVKLTPALSHFLTVLKKDEQVKAIPIETPITVEVDYRRNRSSDKDMTMDDRVLFQMEAEEAKT